MNRMTSIVSDRNKFFNNVFTGCYVYSFKKNGQRCANPTWIDAYGAKNAEEVLARMMKNNPGKKYELA